MTPGLFIRLFEAQELTQFFRAINKMVLRDLFIRFYLLFLFLITLLSLTNLIMYGQIIKIVALGYGANTCLWAATFLLLRIIVLLLQYY